MIYLVDKYMKIVHSFQYDHDKELVGPVTYLPPEGIDGRFYPYAVMENYQQPIVSFVFYFKNLFQKCPE